MTIISPLPYTLTNGTPNDATQVQANFAQIVADTNANAARSGANSDITSLTGLTTPLSAAQGGTGNTTGTANVAGGTAGGVVYQSGANTSAVSAAGTAGQILTSNGTGAPTWGNNAAYYRNFIHNGRGTVAQRPSTGFGAVNTPIYGQCDRWIIGTVGATTQTAGTLDQGTMTCIDGVSRTCIQATGFTTTGAASQIVMKQRLEYRDVADFLNGQTITVQAEVYQATGAAVNYQIQVNAANAADNFSTTTALGTSTTISVPSGATTQISYTLSIGTSAAANGLEFAIYANCGVVTTQTFKMTNVKVAVNSAVSPYDNASRTYHEELNLMQRYLPLLIGSSSQSLGYVNSAGTAGLFSFNRGQNPTRAPITSLFTSGTFSVQDTTGASHSVSAFTVAGSATSAVLTATASGLTANQPAMLTAPSGGYILGIGAEL